ncbi:MAG: class I SAM-dependent methyltransferase [Candidatus Methylomirabilales bacterium]
MAQMQAHKLPKVEVMPSRDEFIVGRCAGKRVLHLGCVGSHAALYVGQSLHLRIAAVARRVVGVDIDEGGLDRLRERGLKKLILGDVQELDKLPICGPFEVIIAGEILEHLPNPGKCVEAVGRIMEPEMTRLIVTVPNAFSMRGLFSVLLFEREAVRSDHNFYFSYVTMSNLLCARGFRIHEIFTYSNLRPAMSGIKRLAKRALNGWLLRFRPFVAEGLIFVVDKPDGGA